MSPTDILTWAWFATTLVGLLARLSVAREELLDWQAAQDNGGRRIAAENALPGSAISALILFGLMVASILALLRVEGRQIPIIIILCLVPIGLTAKAFVERWGRQRLKRYFAAHPK